ncbi:hypothetical protein BGW36DRAFT_422918 [Talaromyces proteolyticus]|uniref:SnoaL-like domain-containing protein n=1 Tax=Talaromyces proteolyticus TaxID=1131652 RepID=A0AAD4Q4T9_9EURO|nr:uncharacterized protein BGW36DRAFT_422918 [Talaromyces proteolyticus]KAH8703355.1 hypothetical protein BGW36DRAFT_422918 [Talaromyces proteolyticus]
MPAAACVQAATLQRFLNAWANWDAQEHLSIFTDDFSQRTLPARLGIPTRSREQVEHTLPILISTVKSYHLTVNHIVHDIERNKAAIYALSKGELPWGPWEMEYSVFITFSEAGDQVAALEEMMDSAVLQEFAPKFAQHMHAKEIPS